MVTIVRILLAVLAFSALGYHFAASWTLLTRVVWNEQAVARPFRALPGTPFVREVSPAALEIGLRSGDEILQLDGIDYGGLADYEQILSRHRPGEALKVRWLREAKTFEGEVLLEATPEKQSGAFRFVSPIVSLITPAACLIVGFGVVLIRPRDPRAWIVWLMMVSFANLGFYSVAQLPKVPHWIAVTSIAYRMMTSALWGVAMLLFALYFPDRLEIDRTHPWLKWIAVGPLLLNAIGITAMRYREYEDHTAFLWLAKFYEEAGSTPFWLVAASVGAFFFILGYRRGTEQRADARRRLKLIQIGMTVGLTPTFLLLVAGLWKGQDPFTTFPAWVVVTSLALLVLYPITMFYVIVMERALDVSVVVRQSLQYALAQRAVMVVQVIAGAVVLAMAANAIANSEGRRVERLQVIVIALLLLFAGQRLAAWLRGWLDRRFFRGAVDAERMLSNLGESVRTIRETPSLLKRVADVLRETLHVEHIEMMLAGAEGMRPAYETGSGNVTELRVPLRAKDRIVGEMVLGPKKSDEPYSKSDMRLLESVADQAGLAIENNELTAVVAQDAAQRERIQKEMEIAQEVQARLFPQELPDIAGLECAGRCRPALSIGGDYYDFYKAGDGLLAVVIADVSGKGVGSALLMASIQGSLRSLTSEGTDDLASVMRRLNRLICDISPGSKYATLFYGQYEPRSRRLTYVNCGHCAPFILRGGETTLLTDGGPVIGLFGGAKFSQSTVVLEPNDVVVGYTDGFSEALNSEDEEWGDPAIVDVVRDAGARHPNEIIDALVDGADRFVAGAPQSDDMTAIVFRVA